MAIKKNVQKLAEDLNIDLSAFHVCLNGVRRGQSTRIKINVQMCYRRYRSKQHVRSGKELLYKETIAHLVYLETSDRKTIAKLKKAKFKIQKAKKGWRYRFASSDTNKIGQVAETLRWLTGGIIEYKFFAGRFKHQSLPALIIPAKNLVKGLYLPVRRGREIFYDEISNIKINQKKMTVYDLEVEKTHNFVANGIVVHNSIYKFRGASISNILHFKNDYPEAELVTLAENYRSAQNILDKAYSLIVNNNPDRLEEKLKISKKLSAKDQAAGVGLIEEITGRSGEEEARLVAEKILELKAEDEKRGDSSWNDFAILIRSNAEADDFILTLERRGVPYQFLASRGLYRAAIVLDIVSYLKLLDNYHENQAAFRVLNLPLWEIATEDIVKMTHLAKKKSHSLFEILKQCRATGVSEKSAQKIDNLLSLIGKHAESARRVSVAKIIYAFLNDSGYLRDLVKRNDKGEGEARRQIMFLKQFYDYVSRFETSREEKLVKHFLEHFNFVLESGEEGSLEQDFESGPEAVKIMTAHSAKGLEFRYVFIVNLVEMRFPSIGRSDPIELPEGLIKEILPEGDSHLQEERRLFYVAMTRAKEGIFFAHADSYGGSRKRKPSRFLGEIQLGVSAPTAAEDEIAILPPPPASFASASAISAPPAHFSYTQLKAFETCPCQYRFAHILHIPVQGSAGFSFGKTMHLALQRFYGQIINLNSANQGDLFAPAPAEAASASGSEGKIKAPSLETLLSFYEEAWIEDWYRDQKQKEEYRAKGRRALKEFYEKAEWTVPKFLEAGFHLEIGGFKLRGQIDRIDSLPDGSVEVIDYKTGNPKKEDKLNLDDKEQLLIYQLAVQEALGERPSLLSFYYLDDNTKVSFLGKKEELEKIKLKIVRNIEAIQKFDFPPNPSPHNCGYCDFKFICEQARL
ncbi:MAG: PD-(D/E)XK nuclease family protein [Candidatus Magasanikbacteria bacterium]|nr:PD-(D/E)XK nuclease family protein [Candidatus Magasanikbacteria bacterium]